MYKKFLAGIFIGLLLSNCASEPTMYNQKSYNQYAVYYNPSSDKYFKSKTGEYMSSLMSEARAKCTSDKKTLENGHCFLYENFDGTVKRNHWEMTYKKEWEQEAAIIAEKKLQRKKVILAQKEHERKRFLNAEKIYSKDCLSGAFKKGFKKGTPEYKKCITKKINDEIVKRKSIEKKLASMSQMERIEYQCENIFNFRKNSSKFKDCALRVYVAESEAQKIKLEKELVFAKLEAAKAKEEAARTRELEQQATLLAQRDQNNTQGLGSFLDLITLGLQIYSLSSPTPSVPASVPTKTLQCFTSGMFKYCS